MAKLGKLTDRQREIYDFIVEFRQENDYAPSIREISAHFKFNLKSAHDHLKALERKEWLRRAGKGSRALEILGPTQEYSISDEKVTRIPIGGRIAAGPTSHREDAVEGYFAVSTELVPSGKLFMVTVEGNSMIEAGIFDGDMVVVRKQTTADINDIVLAKVQKIEEEFTIKRLIKKNNKYFLKPENQTMKPIPFDPTKGGEIRGLIVGLWRNF
jgi:repressor LexA